MDQYILDENDCPRFATTEDFLKWHETIPEEIKTGMGFTLARTESGEVCVSTVFMGLDHSLDNGKPMLWETMVFCEGEHDQTCERSTSRKEALEVHKRFCERYIKETTNHE